MEEEKGKSFDIGSYIKDTGPLTEEEFHDMMAHDNDEISINDLDFEKVVV